VIFVIDWLVADLLKSTSLRVDSTSITTSVKNHPKQGRVLIWF